MAGYIATFLFIIFFFLFQRLNLFIKVGKNFLLPVKFRIFCFCFVVSLLFGDFSLIREYFISTERQKLVYTSGKFLHRKSVFLLNQIFDIVEIACYGSLQTADVSFGQIVLAIVTSDFKIRPSGEFFQVANPIFSALRSAFV